MSFFDESNQAPAVDPKSKNFELQVALNGLKAQRAASAKFERYYKGNHALNYASDKFKVKFGKRLQELRENLCKIVVDVPAARLEVIGFGSDQEDIKDDAWQIWKDNEMPLKVDKLHTEALKTGAGFVIVWQDPENLKAQIFVQDDKSVCDLWIDQETGKPAFGAKMWKGFDKRHYITMYFPDRIEKYISKTSTGSLSDKASSYELREIKGEQNPLDNPFGKIPMFHFTTGESVLSEVISLNNGLNKSLADTFVGMEYNSIRQRYTAGISYAVDPETGKPIIPFEHDDQYVTTTNDQGKIGEFKDMDLKSCIEVSDSMRLAVARVSGIPLQYFYLNKGDFPSGEAQTKSEARLIALVKKAQKNFGNSYGKMMSLCLEIEGAGKDLTIETQWSDAAPASEKEQLENGTLKKGLGWSNKQIQSDFGLDEKTITEMADDVKKQGSELGEALGRAFDQGAGA